VGISRRAYDIASESDNPFYCLFCMQNHYNNVIADLKTQICTLVSKLNQSQPAADKTPSTNSTSSSISAATAVPPNSGTKQPLNDPSVPVTTTKPDTARKFNIILFGLDECSKGTKKMEREKSDISNVSTVLTDLDDSIQSHAIRDTIRLGKYNPSGRPRPLLVTLNRSSDVNIIQSKRAQVKAPFVIKPDLSREARITESHLLKVRWSLIQAKTPKVDIKIRGNKIYVKGQLYGQADSSGFTLIEPPRSTSSNNMDTSSTTTSSSS